MTHMSAVRRFQAGDAPGFLAIVQSLPDYFTDDVPARAERDAARHEACRIRSVPLDVPLCRWWRWSTLRT
jgi:hypothetical protein